MIVTLLSPGGPPFRSSVAACRQAVEYAVQMVHRPLMAASASEERKRLTKVEAKLKAARAAVGDDDNELTAVLDRALAKYRDAIEKLSVERSGAPVGASPRSRRRSPPRRRSTVLEHGGGEPTLSKDGRYIRLTNLLHKVATGKSTDMSRACARYLPICEQMVFPTLLSFAGCDALAGFQTRWTGRSDPRHSRRDLLPGLPYPAFCLYR